MACPLPPGSPSLRLGNCATLTPRCGVAYMANRRTHEIVGVGVGVAYSSYRAKDQDSKNFLLEVLGGALGGYVGGRLPDVVEPGTSSWHRDVGHSLTAGAAVVSSQDLLARCEAFCREQAERCRAIAMVPVVGSGRVVFVHAPADPLAQLSMKAAELLWRFLAGFLNGLAAGYVSHLALDARTPRSIPLLTSRF